MNSGTTGTPTSLQNLSYVYDAVGNISNITNTKASETSVYGYDTLDRLTSWTLNGGTPETYGYDLASGNFTNSYFGVNLVYRRPFTLGWQKIEESHFIFSEWTVTVVYFVFKKN